VCQLKKAENAFILKILQPVVIDIANLIFSFLCAIFLAEQPEVVVRPEKK